MSLVVGPQPVEEKDAPMEAEGGVKRGPQVIEKPVHLVCGGLEKRIVFQQAVLPVLKTVCQKLNCDVKDYVQKLVAIMFAGRESL